MTRRKRVPDPTGMQTSPSPRPVTAQPIGSVYVVNTRGLSHVDPGIPGTKYGKEHVSDNFLERDPGCYRREPCLPDQEHSWSVEREQEQDYSEETSELNFD